MHQAPCTIVVFFFTAGSYVYTTVCCVFVAAAFQHLPGLPCQRFAKHVQVIVSDELAAFFFQEFVTDLSEFSE